MSEKKITDAEKKEIIKKLLEEEFLNLPLGSDKSNLLKAQLMRLNGLQGAAKSLFFKSISALWRDRKSQSL